MLPSTIKQARELTRIKATAISNTGHLHLEAATTVRGTEGVQRSTPADDPILLSQYKQSQCQHRSYLGTPTKRR